MDDLIGEKRNKIGCLLCLACLAAGCIGFTLGLIIGAAEIARRTL